MFSKLLVLMIGATIAISASAGEHRSPAAVREFKKHHPCPATVSHSKRSCPGYVVDHVKALACGGADHYTNMQWQTVADGKAKDKWERKGCHVQRVKGWFSK